VPSLAALALAAVAAVMIPVTNGQAPARPAVDGAAAPRDEHPPVFAHAPVASAAAPLPDDDMVIGLVVEGHARAYPVRSLWEESGHTVNDAIGGQPVAVSMCPLSGVGAAFSRRSGRETLEIGSLKDVDRGSLVLYDRRSHTHYRLLTGEGFAGPRAGSHLERLPTVFTTWGRWRAAHPETTVHMSPADGRDYQLDASRLRRMVLTGARAAIADRDWVVGVEGSATSTAFLVRTLAYRRVANESVDGRPIVLFVTEDLATTVVWERVSAGRTLTFRADGDRMADSETGSTWDPVTGRAVAGPLEGRRLAPVRSVPGFWHAWKAEHPDTALKSRYGD
jgi:hypothetical protein